MCDGSGISCLGTAGMRGRRLMEGEGFGEAPVIPGWGEPLLPSAEQTGPEPPRPNPWRLHYCWRGDGLHFPKQSTAMFPVI